MWTRAATIFGSTSSIIASRIIFAAWYARLLLPPNISNGSARSLLTATASVRACTESFIRFLQQSFIWIKFHAPGCVECIEPKLQCLRLASGPNHISFLIALGRGYFDRHWIVEGFTRLILLENNRQEFSSSTMF